MKQETISDVEYSARKRKTKREEFLEIMDEIIPWEEWVAYAVFASAALATAFPVPQSDAGAQ